MADISSSTSKPMESMEAVEPISQISEALRVIEDVNETSSKCLVNKHQCNRLADRVNAIGEILKELPKPELVGSNSAGTSKMDYPAFDMLLSVLRKGKALVSKYVEATASIPSVLIRTENKAAFEEIHSDLDTMNSQFPFEDFESSTSQSKRGDMLRADADQDLKEISEGLDKLACSNQSLQASKNLDQVKLVVSEKIEGTGDDLPSFLKIDPATVEVSKPVRNPERLSKHDPAETDGWALVRFGSWLGCKCALKVFQSGNETWNRNELLKEAEALLKLLHPHIVQLMGFARDEDKCLFLMELMDTDLRHFMKSRQGKRPFSRAQELEIITQIARGMYYLHEQQYVHGELKCSNILVKQYPGGHLDVKISDLRSAQKLGDWDPVLFKERSQRRRPRWTAPEVKNYGEVEPAPSHALLKKTDVYSFGMVCYEVITGKLPFQDIVDDALKTRIETGDLKQDLPSDLDDNLRGLIESCWEREPEKRPTFELICHKLEFIRSSQPLAQPVVTSTSSGKTAVMDRLRLIPLVTRLFRGREAKIDPPTNTWGDPTDAGMDSDPVSADVDMALPEFVRINRADLKRGRLLGTGATAKVYEATWLGCKYAVKAFKVRSTIQTLQKELKFLIELRHPSIARLMGLSVSSEGQCMIVMEFMGGDLRREMDRRMESRKRKRGTEPVRVHDGPFDLLEAVHVINRIAMGMAYLHSRGVIHRDLKALNVLVPEQYGSIDVKITDFGVSEFIVSRENSSSGVAGTSFWRAPEMFSGQQYDRKAADVYSFGVTCYEVLTGRSPFAEGGVDRSAVINGLRPELPSDLKPNLKLLIEECWNGKPEMRPEFTTICRRLQEIQQELRASASAPA